MTTQNEDRSRHVNERWEAIFTQFPDENMPADLPAQIRAAIADCRMMKKTMLARRRFAPWLAAASLVVLLVSGLMFNELATVTSGVFSQVESSGVDVWVSAVNPATPQALERVAPTGGIPLSPLGVVVLLVIVGLALLLLWELEPSLDRLLPNLETTHGNL